MGFKNYAEVGTICSPHIYRHTHMFKICIKQNTTNSPWAFGLKLDLGVSVAAAFDKLMFVFCVFY